MSNKKHDCNMIHIHLDGHFPKCVLLNSRFLGSQQELPERDSTVLGNKDLHSNKFLPVVLRGVDVKVY